MHSEFIQVHPQILGCKHWRAAVRLCYWIFKSDTCAVEQSISDSNGGVGTVGEFGLLWVDLI